MNNLNLLCIALLIFTEIAFAEFKVRKDTQTGEISLEAPSCIELKNEIASMQIWKTKRGETPKVAEINCELSPETRIANITQILPDFVRKSYGHTPRCMGPNCFNATIVENKIRNHIRFTGPSEYRFYLNSNCKQRQMEQGDTPEPGDIAVIQKKRSDGKAIPEHGFVFIGKTAFTKNGLFGNPYEIMDLENVLTFYNVDQDPRCRYAKGLPEGCEYFVNYFSCRDDISDRFSDIDDFEENLSACVNLGRKTKRNQTGLDDSAFDGLVKNFSHVQEQLWTQDQVTRPSKLNKAILQSYTSQMMDITDEPPVLNRKSWKVPQNQKQIFDLLDSDSDNDRLNQVGEILSAGISPNIQDIDGTPLLWRILRISSDGKRSQLIGHLIRLGVALNKGYEGKIALTYLLSRDNPRDEHLAMELVKRGADPDLRDKEGNSFRSLLQEKNKQELLLKLQNIVPKQ